MALNTPFQNGLALSGSLIAGMALGGCVNIATTPTQEPSTIASSIHAECEGEKCRESKLFLGMGGYENTPVVTAFELMTFIDETLPSTFAAGYTLLHGSGAWLSEHEEDTDIEPSAIMLVLHPTDPTVTKELRKIGEDYIAEFDQEASLLGWTEHRTEFIPGAGR